MSKNDGGPAFPLQYDPFVDHPAHGRIHRAALGVDVQVGMSLRDHFAGQALAGLLASGPHDCGPPGLAHDAYLYADAMLAERTKQEAENARLREGLERYGQHRDDCPIYDGEECRCGFFAVLAEREKKDG